jgi:hypothetical protein
MRSGTISSVSRARRSVRFLIPASIASLAISLAERGPFQSTRHKEFAESSESVILFQVCWMGGNFGLVRARRDLNRAGSGGSVRPSKAKSQAGLACLTAEFSARS